MPAPDIVIGRNPRMQAIFEYLAVVGPGQGTVLVTGESGTGKEVVARMLHRHSGRRERPFVPVSCALFSDTLIESELFGHERGAFTGAVAARPGRFERAEGGTLFLDDIDDVPLSMQVKLLRALQNRTIERLGGSRAVPVDVRVVAGTKCDLLELVRAGRFREDLYYRLHVLTVDLPPLRDRRDDLPVLIDHFMRRFFQRRGMEVPPISSAVRQALLAYDWPGNVRELENMCERIAESCMCGHVRLGCLGASVLFPPDDEPPGGPHAGSGTMSEGAGPRSPGPDDERQRRTSTDSALPLDEHLRQVEAQRIAEALATTGGNKSRAAELLGIKRSTLGDRIARCGLKGTGLGLWETREQRIP
jgi:DNA-binding NtrC family response regulator